MGGGEARAVRCVDEEVVARRPPTPLKAEITFDCLYPEDCDHIEGCYRLLGKEWQVYYFTRWWQGEPEVLLDAIFQSGTKGVNVKHPKDEPLNKSVVMAVLAKALNVTEWSEVSGPDSLTLK